MPASPTCKRFNEIISEIFEIGEISASICVHTQKFIEFVIHYYWIPQSRSQTIFDMFLSKTSFSSTFFRTQGIYKKTTRKLALSKTYIYIEAHYYSCILWTEWAINTFLNVISSNWSDRSRFYYESSFLTTFLPELAENMFIIWY